MAIHIVRSIGGKPGDCAGDVLGLTNASVSGASWPEFDLKARTWLLPSARTKNARTHLVPLSDAAVDVLTGVPRFADGQFLFGLGGRTEFTGYSKAKARIDARTAKLVERDIAAWTLHDLRRTCATGMARIGVAPHVIEAVLNHVSGSRAGVAGIYNTYAYEPEKRDALMRWAEHIERLDDRNLEGGSLSEASP